MSLAYIRGPEYSTSNRIGFFWNAIYAPQAQQIRKADSEASCCITDELIQQYRAELARYHIYFERQYGAWSGDAYSVHVSQKPLRARGIFRCEYIIDYGPLLNFFDEYFGIAGGMLSERKLRRKYRKLQKLEAYNLHEFAWFLVRIAREIIFREYSQDLFDEGRIRHYGLDLAWNNISVTYDLEPGVSSSIRHIEST